MSRSSRRHFAHPRFIMLLIGHIAAVACSAWGHVLFH